MIVLWNIAGNSSTAKLCGFLMILSVGDSIFVKASLTMPSQHQHLSDQSHTSLGFLTFSGKTKYKDL